MMLMGCGNRQDKKVVPGPAAAITPPATQPSTSPATQAVGALQPVVKTFHSSPSAVQFDYPADWVPDKAQTACMAIRAPGSAGTGYSSLSLDIPKLPWHLPGMITVGMVCNGYIDDLKKHQIHDAVVKEKVPITVCGCTGQRITCRGHDNGQPSIDVAIILIHADHVYVLSVDSDETGCDTARKTLDVAIASWKWTK
jgi:hypothetical protein